MAEVRRGFELNGDGLRAAAARSKLVDELVQRFWAAEMKSDPQLSKLVTVCAVGGYGRGHLYPYSDVDLLFCTEQTSAGEAVQAAIRAAILAAIRAVTQSLWDCGMQVSAATRSAAECARFDAENPEFAIALLDLRFLCGEEESFARLSGKVAALLSKKASALGVELAKLTRVRHAKYGDTLFHLEPNIKDCPGGLRDANVCVWLRRLYAITTTESDEFEPALGFLAAVRCFLHYRHQRDDNTLDWQAQDAAAAAKIGLPARWRSSVDGAYWMRAYFRHARVLERCLLQAAEEADLRLEAQITLRRHKFGSDAGFRVADGRVELAVRSNGVDLAQEPEVVLAAFAAMAKTGARLSRESEERVSDAVPLLSANLEEGPGLWRQLCEVLTGEFAGRALRSMHTLGVLELILPEFHGIDALVIRDAYHRYTVDEHTFVLIDTLHGLEAETAGSQIGPKTGEWRARFTAMLAELQQPGLLYLAALLHDTGKGMAGGDHAAQSARMAQSVLRRLEMDLYDSAQVVRLIELHLEMSAALRRDIFDAETVRTFAGKVQTHELLRMLALFTYADIAAVHPDALTPWKAENLWRLAMATANQLDRNVDEERLHARVAKGVLGDGWRKDEKIARVLALEPTRQALVEQFLEGFPERYVSTRTPEVMQRHFEMTQHFGEEPFQIMFQYSASVSEITLVTEDRPRLFAGMTAALAAWGMNVVTADAFANASGVVVDSFRFTDTFRTLELNPEERERFVESVRELVSGRLSAEKLLSGRKRGRRRAPKITVATKVEFDAEASTHSTLLQVVAQDVPGLLKTISATVSELGYNLEVALVDTEGETAIDVFYLTSNGQRLTAEQEGRLGEALLEAIAGNAG
jgi:[protein-PII] uridylyltransferase